MAYPSRLDEWLASFSFRVRLLRLALSPISRVPAAVVIAMESSDYDSGWLDYRPDEHGAPTGRWV